MVSASMAGTCPWNKVNVPPEVAARDGLRERLPSRHPGIRRFTQRHGWHNRPTLPPFPGWQADNRWLAWRWRWLAAAMASADGMATAAADGMAMAVVNGEAVTAVIGLAVTAADSMVVAAASGKAVMARR
jgi:hypothetical protein